jgi:hypothetical protein
MLPVAPVISMVLFRELPRILGFLGRHAHGTICCARRGMRSCPESPGFMTVTRLPGG